MKPTEEIDDVDDMDDEEAEFDSNDDAKDEIDIWAVDLDDEGIKDFDPDVFIEEGGPVTWSMT